MPTQKDLMVLNDAVMLSRAARQARAAHAQQRYEAIWRREDRMVRRQIRAQRRAAQLVALDAALAGACVLALAAMLVYVTA